MGEMPGLIKYLRWIADNRIIQAEWLRNGKSAYGRPEEWNQHRLSSRDSSITVSSDVHFAAVDFTEVGPLEGSMFVLNDAGRAALSKAEGRSLSSASGQEGGEA